jgi:hypothetical protein
MSVTPPVGYTPVPGYPNVYESEFCTFIGIDPLDGSVTQHHYGHPCGAKNALTAGKVVRTVQAAG